MALAAAFVLTACAAVTGPSIAPTPTTGVFEYLGQLDPTVKPPKMPVEGGAAAFWRTDSELVLTTWGSSSCYPVPFDAYERGPQLILIETVYGTVTEPGKAVVNEGGPCTADFGPTSFTFDTLGLDSSEPAQVAVSERLPGQERTERTVYVTPFKR